MADVRSAWNDAGGHFSELGQKLKQHYAQQRGNDAERERTQVEEAVGKLADALRGAFDAMGAAAKDPAVKSEVKQVGKTVGDALGVTFAEISDELRKAFNRGPAAGDEAGSAEPGTGPAATGEPAPTAEPTAPQAEAAAPPAAGGDEQPPKVEPWGTP